MCHGRYTPNRYETRLKKTVEVCDVLLISDVHCFEKHPYGQSCERHQEAEEATSKGTTVIQKQQGGPKKREECKGVKQEVHC